MMTTNITIEDIGGVPHTVIWHIDAYDWDTQKLDIDWLDQIDAVWFPSVFGREYYDDCKRPVHIATALPPLPRCLTPKHAPLLHLYAAHGLGIHACESYGDKSGDYNLMMILDELSRRGLETTHAIHADTGKRVDVAIVGGEA